MVAKLRTLTGCLLCRRRRKKCDENKPVCIACTRNGLHCQWPAVDRVDRRRLRHRKAVQKISCRPIRTVTETCEETTSKLFDSIKLFEHVINGKAPMLVEYCLFSFLPSQYHQAADGKPTIDLSYLRYMCLDSPLLLNAVSACALVASHGEMADTSQESSHKMYMAAISEISTGIAKGSLTGTEDSLLATVIWLCVYENSRVEGRRQSAIHAAALRRILLLREPMDRNHASISELIWERMCVESYIYHSAVTTLFDGQINLIEDTLMVLKKFQTRISSTSWALDTPQVSDGFYEEGRTHQLTVQSPVLGAPYHMFLFLMEGTRLARTANLTSAIDQTSAWSRYYEVLLMQTSLEENACTYYGDSRRWIGKLYAVAIRLLFLYVIAALSYDTDPVSELNSSWYTEIEATISEARSLLITTENDIDRTWGKFFLWPLAVIGAMIHNNHDVSLVRSWLDRVVRKSNSSSVLVIRKVLEERIWNMETHQVDALDHDPRFYTQGLSIMLDTNTMNNTAMSLIDQTSDTLLFQQSYQSLIHRDDLSISTQCKRIG